MLSKADRLESTRRISMTIDEIILEEGNDMPLEDAIVVTEESATVAISRVAAIENKIARIKAIRDAELQRITQWAEKEMGTLKATGRFFSDPLESFMRARNRQNPKIKSLKYPNGTIGVRMTPDRIEIEEGLDLAALVEKDDPFVVASTTFQIAKKAILKALKEDGQEPPEYATLVPGEKKFYIKLMEGDQDVIT